MSFADGPPFLIDRSYYIPHFQSRKPPYIKTQPKITKWIQKPKIINFFSRNWNGKKKFLVIFSMLQSWSFIRMQCCQFIWFIVNRKHAIFELSPVRFSIFIYLFSYATWHQHHSIPKLKLKIFFQNNFKNPDSRESHRLIKQ